MKRLALALLLVFTAGCASHARRAAPTATIPPPQAGTSPPAVGSETGPPQASKVAAPWDTAGTASARAARRNHVYPRGPSALGQKLVDALPDPAGLARGAESSEPTRAASVKPEPLPVNDRACWEVQVLVTTSESRANEEARRIAKTLDLAAWVRSEGAIYRVRVGGCLNADGAAELANRLHLEGYPEAFRVMREP